VCSVPAASLIGEAMVCLTLAGPVSDKYGGDSIEEVAEHFASSQHMARELFQSPQQ